MTKLTLKTIDCFAGCGGLSLGLQRAGFDISFAFDLSPQAVATYSRNIAPHIVESNVHDLNEADLRGHLTSAEEVGLIAGGPPCQGFSRQRRGSIKDERNELVFEFLRIVGLFRPTMFLMENVSGIRGRRGAAYLDSLIHRAREMGYFIHQAVLNAADFGVPQIRKRMFLVGEIDKGEVYFSFPQATHSPDDYVTVRDAFDGLPEPSAACRSFHNHQPDNISDLNRLRISHVPPGGGRDDIPEHLRLPCHVRSADEIGHRGVYGRLSWDTPSGTITTKCNSFTRGRFAHPEANRNITMREAARLQSFPDDFVFEGDKVSVAHQIGNAVPPLLAQHLANSVLTALKRRAAGKPGHRSTGQRLLVFE